MHPLPEGRGERSQAAKTRKSRRARGREERGAQEEREGREQELERNKEGETFINCTVLRQYGNKKMQLAFQKYDKEGLPIHCKSTGHG
jgi:hypothetical protein